MGYGHSLSAGIQGGYGQRKADISRLSFMSQWNGSYLDPTILSGEANSVTSFRYIDASAGLYYVYDGSKNNFARKNEMKIQFGLAGFHLNAPELKFSNGINGERLHRKYVGNLGIVSDIVGSKFAIDASVVQFVQGGHYETLLGMMVRYRFEDGTKMTGLSHNAFVGFGCYTRLKDAIIPSVMVDWRGFQFGVSYDITLSALRYAYKGGSLEFSLTYRNVHDALFKTRKRRF
jgi:type IX secretion system PorP/SprF family membrane protein